MTEEELKKFVDERSWPELTTLMDLIEVAKRDRRINYLLTLECNCDRYTCLRCQELYDELHYKAPKKESAT